MKKLPNGLYVLIALTVLVAAVFTARSFARPSNQRRWSVGQERLPLAEFSGDVVTVHNVRNFTYAPDGTPTPRYETRAYDLSKLETVWFILVPFSRTNRTGAHTFLSFGFSDQQYVGISVEARKEVGEEYSLLGGLLRRFEIMYVVGDERDLIGLRSNIRDNDVYVYPVKTTPDKARTLFVQMLARANSLRTNPEFYNTLTNNCTTAIVRHANAIVPHRIPYGIDVLLPGYSDQLAEKLGLIDTTLPLAQARERYRVNERARRYADDPNFSVKIRAAE